MVLRAKVRSDSAISIPDDAMRKLQIAPGSNLLIDVRDGYLLLLPEPEDYVEHLHGLHREVWEGIDPDEYVRQEREAWQG